VTLWAAAIAYASQRGYTVVWTNSIVPLLSVVVSIPFILCCRPGLITLQGRPHPRLPVRFITASTILVLWICFALSSGIAHHMTDIGRAVRPSPRSRLSLGTSAAKSGYMPTCLRRKTNPRGRKESHPPTWPQPPCAAERSRLFIYVCHSPTPQSTTSEAKMASITLTILVSYRRRLPSMTACRVTRWTRGGMIRLAGTQARARVRWALRIPMGPRAW